MGNESWGRNLAALCVVQLFTVMAFQVFFPFIPLYVKVLGVQGDAAAAQWTGLIMAGGAAAMAIVQPFWGNMADRWGRRTMVLRSSLCNTVLVLLQGFATGPEQLLVLRIVQGAFTGTVAASNALVASTTPKHRLGFALGVLQVAYFSGTSLGPFVGGLIADALGYRAAFFFGAALMLTCLPIVLIFVSKDVPVSRGETGDRGWWSQTRWLLALGLMPTMIWVIFLIHFGVVTVNPVLSLFVEELTGGVNVATVAGTIMGATGVMSAVAAVTAGRLGDRFGHLRIVVFCLAGAAVTNFLQTFVTQTWDLLVLRAMLGVFLGGMMPSANAIVAGLVPSERRGAAFGLIHSAIAASHAVAPVTGAAIASQWGIRAVFTATGALYALGFLSVSLRVRLRQDDRLPRPAVSDQSTRDHRAGQD